MKLRALLVVFAATLAIRILLNALSDMPLWVAYASSDCAEYMQHARNLAQHGAFSAAVEPPYVRTLFRTPVYPLLIAGMLKISPDEEFGVRLMIWLQLLAGALTATFCAWAIFLLKDDWRWATLGGLLAGFEPDAIRFSMWLWSETMFSLLFLLGVVGLLYHLRSQHHRYRYVLISGLFFGLAALCRPVGHYVALAGSGIALLMHPTFSLRQRIGKAVIPFLVAYSVVVLPWMVRNYGLFGMFDLSNSGAVSKIQLAAWIRAAEKHATWNPNPRDWLRELKFFYAEYIPEFNAIHDVSVRQMGNDYTIYIEQEKLTGEFSRFMVEKAMPIVRRHKGLYLKSSLATCYHVLFGFDKDVLCRILDLPKSGQSVSDAGRDFLQGKFSEGVDGLARVRYYEWIGFVWAGGYAILANGLALWGVIVGIRKGFHVEVILFLVLIGLLIALPSFAVSFGFNTARYSVPTVPYLAILATWGLQGLFQWFHKRLTTRHSQPRNHDPSLKA